MTTRWPTRWSSTSRRRRAAPTSPPTSPARAIRSCCPAGPTSATRRTRRRLVALDSGGKSETTVSLSGPEPIRAPGRSSGACRWCRPTAATPPTIVVSSDNKHRYVAALGPTPGTTRIVEHLQDTAWVRALDESGPPPTTMGFVPGTARLWFLSERDGWMHLYLADLAAPDTTPKQLTSGAWEITDAQLTPDGRQFLIVSSEADAGDRQVYALPVDGGTRTRLTAMPGAHAIEPSPDGATWALLSSFGEPAARGVPGTGAQGGRHGGGRARPRDGRAGDDEPDAGVAGGEVDRAAHRHLQGPRRGHRAGPPLHAGNGRGEAKRRRAGGGLRARRRLSPERAPLLVVLLPRVHVPSPARVEGLRGARSRLSRQRRLRPRMAHRDLSPHGRRRSRRRRRRRALAGGGREGRSRGGSASMAAATAASSR